MVGEVFEAVHTVKWTLHNSAHFLLMAWSHLSLAALASFPLSLLVAPILPNPTIPPRRLPYSALCHTDRQTDRQTDSSTQYYSAQTPGWAGATPTGSAHSQQLALGRPCPVSVLSHQSVEMCSLRSETVTKGRGGDGRGGEGEGRGRGGEGRGGEGKGRRGGEGRGGEGEEGRGGEGREREGGEGGEGRGGDGREGEGEGC